MRRVLMVAGLAALTLLLGCPKKEPDPVKKRERPPLVRCPVEGTEFVAGSGVTVELPGRSVEVCTPGCAYTFRLEPERFPGAPR